jgi:hypothetical protein
MSLLQRGCFTLVFMFASLFVVRVRAAEITVYAGGVKPGKLNISGLTTALGGSPIVGFRLKTDFVPHFGMEHTLGYSSDYLFPKSITAIGDAKGFVFNSNLILSLPTGHMVPYITAGIGFVHQYGSPNLPIGTKFAVNYGGGLKFPRLVGPLGFRADARAYTATGLFSHKLNMLEVSGGLLISIGK